MDFLLEDTDLHSLYIHWPFCPYKCHFCPFVAMANLDYKMDEYYQALKNELLRHAKIHGNELKLSTIYIGGGTPSTWPDHLLLDMFATLKAVCEIKKISEITVEANPGTVRPEQIKVWQEIGVTRVSMGVQSLDDAVLKSLNRLQSNQQVVDLLALLDGEIKTLSIDLIIGLPGVTPEAWKAMVKTVVAWPIHHLSVYFLSVHDTTPLYFRLKRKEFILPADDDLVDLYYWTVETLEKHGFYQYEISSFAKSGYESKHNQVYWNRQPYKGIGVGACSFDGKRRFQHTKNLMDYCQAQQEQKDDYCLEEELSSEQIRSEEIMLGLRTKNGVKLSTIVQVSHERKKIVEERVEQLVQKKYIKVVRGHVYLIPTALAVEHEVAVLLTA